MADHAGAAQGGPRLDGPRPVRALPPAALADLQRAFAGDVAVRLPRLLADPLGADALRNAHTLGSSAVVVGLPDVSRTARALEAELSAAAPDPDRVHGLVQELADRLSLVPAP